MQEQMELANLDIALDSLQEAIKTKHNKGYKKYLDRLDFLNRAIHRNVWRDHIPIERVKKEIFLYSKKLIRLLSIL